MEWVETTGKTIEEAKEAALDQLGVDESEAEFEILEEAKNGLFGRVRREARVRARVEPTRPRPKADRRERRRKPPGQSKGNGKGTGKAAAPSAAASAGETGLGGRSLAFPGRGQTAEACRKGVQGGCEQKGAAATGGGGQDRRQTQEGRREKENLRG